LPNQLDLYLKLKYRIQDWLMGGAGACDLADFCGMTLQTFKDTLMMWGVCDVTGRPRENLTEQDVFNAIFMLEIKRLAQNRVKRGK